MRTVAGGVLAALCVCAPQAALAAGNSSSGVHVDPGSPAGKQYSFPITSARGETAGNSSGSRSGSGNPPLFGAGITPSSSARAASTTTAGSSHRSGSAATRHDGSARGGATHRRRKAHSAAASSSPGSHARPFTQSSQVGGSTWLPLAGGGALVLLVGCGGGLALRRRT